MILLCHSHNKALGLSAPQLGVLSRVIVCKYGEDYIGIINPEIVKKSDRTFPSVEGCLSIAGGRRRFIVMRSKKVKVKGLTTNGKPITYKGRGFFGAALQHEIDHLDGILISDKGTEHA
jgi:peptide deformylase